jgi:hypothetical protein
MNDFSSVSAHGRFYEWEEAQAEATVCGSPGVETSVWLEQCE